MRVSDLSPEEFLLLEKHKESIERMVIDPPLPRFFDISGVFDMADRPVHRIHDCVTIDANPGESVADAIKASALSPREKTTWLDMFTRDELNMSELQAAKERAQHAFEHEAGDFFPEGRRDDQVDGSGDTSGGGNVHR